MALWGIEESEAYWSHPTITLDDDMWWIVPARAGAATVRLPDLLPAFASHSYVLLDHSTPLDASGGATAYLYHEQNDFHVCLDSAEWGDFYLGVKADVFLEGPPEDAVRHADLFIDAGALCLNRLGRPYAFAGSPLCPAPRLDDILAGRLTHVFWAQWFGPRVLDGLGRDAILQAPAWRNQPLAGGILYCPAASPIQTTDRNGRWAGAQRYFTERFTPPPAFQRWNQIDPQS